MKNPKSEIPNPKQTRSPKSETKAVDDRRLALGSPAWRRIRGWVDKGIGGLGNATVQSSIYPSIRLWKLPLLAALLTANAAALHGQTYSLEWFSLDGGGGTSTGGVYSVSGTIGQPDAGVMRGGPFTLVGGFWGIVAAVQTEGAPYLSVTRSNAAVLVSWPQPAPDWKLEWTAVLPSPPNAWTLIPPPYLVSGTNWVFTEPVPLGNRFYRLRKP